MKKIISLSILTAISLVGCNSGVIGSENNALNSQKQLSTNNDKIGSIAVDEIKADKVEVAMLRQGNLTLSGTIDKDDFSIKNFPSSITATFTTGNGQMVWFNRYIPGKFTINLKKPICNLKFDNVYGIKDLVFGDSSECNNKQNGSSCTVPYYGVANGVPVKTSQKIYVPYQYQLPIDGRNCGNGVFPVIVAQLPVEFLSSNDNDYHPVFDLSNAGHPIAANYPRVNNRLSLAVKMLQNSVIFGSNIFSEDAADVEKTTESDLLWSYKKVQDNYLSRTNLLNPYVPNMAACDAKGSNEKYIDYHLDSKLDTLCSNNFGSSRGLKVIVPNISTTSMMEAEFSTNISTVHLLDQKGKVAISPARDHTYQVCINDSLFNHLLYADERVIGKSASDDFLVSRNLFSIRTQYPALGRDFSQQLIVSLDNEVKINDKISTMNSIPSSSGICQTSTNPLAPIALPELATDVGWDGSRVVEYFARLKFKTIQTGSEPTSLNATYFLLNNSRGQYVLSNVGVDKFLGSVSYAKNIDYYLLDVNKKEQAIESFNLFLPRLISESGDVEVYKFTDQEIAKEWHSQVSSMLNWFPLVENNESQFSKGGFVVVTYNDNDSQEGDQPYFQIFPLEVSNNRILIDAEHNVLDNQPIIRNTDYSVGGFGDNRIVPFSAHIDNLNIFQTVFSAFRESDNEAMNVEVPVEVGGFEYWFTKYLKENNVNNLEEWKKLAISPLAKKKDVLMLGNIDQWANNLFVKIDQFAEYLLPDNKRVKQKLYSLARNKYSDGNNLGKERFGQVRLDNSTLTVKLNYTTSVNIKELIGVYAIPSVYGHSYPEVARDNHDLVIHFGSLPYYNYDSSRNKFLNFPENLNAEYPVDIKVYLNGTEPLVFKLNCYVNSNSCKWPDNRSPLPVQVGNEYEIVPRLINNSTGANVTIDISKSGTNVIIPDNKITYLLNDLNYEMMFLEEDNYFWIGATKLGKGYYDRIEFKTSDLVDGTRMEKDITNNVMGDINNLSRRKQICTWDSTKATMSCQFGIWVINPGSDHIRNATFTLGFVIPSPNGEWQTKILQPKDVSWVQGNGLLPSQKVVGGSQNKYTGVQIEQDLI